MSELILVNDLESIIDFAIEDNGSYKPKNLNLTVPELCEKYPGVYVDSYEYWMRGHVQTKVKEISCERYFDALETLPPLEWTHIESNECFKFMERWNEQYTTIYVKYKTLGRCFEFLGKCSLTPDEIFQKVRAFLNAEEAEKNSVEPEPEKKMVKVNEYRRGADHLNRLANVDWCSCVGIKEIQAWKQRAENVLHEIEQYTCKRANDDDLKGMKSAIMSVKKRLASVADRIKLTTI